MKKYRLLKDLPTFKAGEIFKLKGGNLYYYPAENGTENTHWSDKIMAYHHKTLEKFPNILDEWFEEVEEPKDYWVIDIRDGAGYKPYLEEPSEMDFEIGNYFETKEEAEKAVEKLKCFTNLKNHEFMFDGWYYGADGNIVILANAHEFNDMEEQDLTKVFGEKIC